MKAGGAGAAWWASVVLSAVGLVDSVYLTWIKVANRAASCAGIGDCETVNNSRFSEIGGVPIALLGAGAYVLLLLLLVGERRGWISAEASRMAVFGLALAGTLYSLYLTYVEIAILRAICPFCVVSAVAIIGILVLSLIRLLREDAHGNLMGG